MTSSLTNTRPSQIGIGESQAQVTDWFQQQLLAALANPLFNVPKEFVTYMIDRVATSGLNIPIGQIIGFEQFTFQFAYDATLYQTASSTFQNPGPIIHGVSPGRYIIFWGAQAAGSAATIATMDAGVNSVSLGGSAATKSSSLTSVMAAVPADVADVNSDITPLYKSSDGATTCSWQGRFVLLIRYANA